jgi:hypothetical protein
MTKQERDKSHGPATDSPTPGKPSDSASRQQTHKGQNSQSGSPDFDREHSRNSGTPGAPLKPPGAK